MYYMFALDQKILSTNFVEFKNIKRMHVHLHIDPCYGNVYNIQLQLNSFYSTMNKFFEINGDKLIEFKFSVHKNFKESLPNEIDFMKPLYENILLYTTNIQSLLIEYTNICLSNINSTFIDKLLIKLPSLSKLNNIDLYIDYHVHGVVLDISEMSHQIENLCIKSNDRCAKKKSDKKSMISIISSKIKDELPIKLVSIYNTIVNLDYQVSDSSKITYTKPNNVIIKSLDKKRKVNQSNNNEENITQQYKKFPSKEREYSNTF